MITLPYIIEKVGRNKKTFDIPTKLYEQGIITLTNEIDDDIAYSIISQLLYLDTLDSDENIKLYINSPGGVVTSGLAIYDTIKAMNRKVDTIGMGSCASMGSFLLLAGTGERKALKNTRIMLHSISGGFVGNYHDHKVNFKESEYIQNKLIELIAENTNNSKEFIEDITKRDYYMSATEAKELNIIDTII